MTIHYMCDNYTRTWDCKFDGEVELEEGMRGDRETGVFHGECPKCKQPIERDRYGDNL